MKAVWVDTDCGFDDVWALLLLRDRKVGIGGVSLVAGNTTLPQVVANAVGANRQYGLDLQLLAGANRPLRAERVTAERILGRKGMRSRGRYLREPEAVPDLPDAVPMLAQWLLEAEGHASRDVLALGPLTNIARLVLAAPEAARRITRLVWMGGANGPGNHSPVAEFNSFADPDAVATIVDFGLPMDVVDLTVCRRIAFGPANLPKLDGLTSDLLGGHLDIALERGRPRMAIYDPVAALALVSPDLFRFASVRMMVSVLPDASRGATAFRVESGSRTRLATAASSGLAELCLAVLERNASHGD